MKYMAFICRSDSRSAISSQRWNNWDSNLWGVFTNLLRSRPIFQLGDVVTVLRACLTLCMQGWSTAGEGQRCTYSSVHMDKEVTVGSRVRGLRWG